MTPKAAKNATQVLTWKTPIMVRNSPTKPVRIIDQDEAVQLTAVIAALQQTGVAASVKRASADLAAGFIAPVADGTVGDLANRQNQVMETVRASVAAQSAALTAAA